MPINAIVVPYASIECCTGRTGVQQVLLFIVHQSSTQGVKLLSLVHLAGQMPCQSTSQVTTLQLANADRLPGSINCILLIAALFLADFHFYGRGEANNIHLLCFEYDLKILSDKCIEVVTRNCEKMNRPSEDCYRIQHWNQTSSAVMTST